MAGHTDTGARVASNPSEEHTIRDKLSGSSPGTVDLVIGLVAEVRVMAAGALYLAASKQVADSCGVGNETVYRPQVFSQVAVVKSAGARSKVCCQVDCGDDSICSP